MFKFTFTRTPKPRQFNHVPIYWNPEEEKRRERNERIERELGEKPADGEFHSRIKRGSFRKKKWDVPDETSDMRAERRRANTRLLIIALALTAITVALYLIF